MAFGLLRRRPSLCQAATTFPQAHSPGHAWFPSGGFLPGRGESAGPLLPRHCRGLRVSCSVWFPLPRLLRGSQGLRPMTALVAVAVIGISNFCVPSKWCRVSGRKASSPLSSGWDRARLSCLAEALLPASITPRSGPVLDAGVPGLWPPSPCRSASRLPG